MNHRPSVVAFDVVETLFSLDALGDRFQQAGLPGDSLQLWFSRFLRDAFALEVAGIYRSFGELAAGTVGGLLEEHGLVSGKEGIEVILKGFSELRPHPDVQPAMEELRNAGVRMVALTNGSAEITRTLFAEARLDGMIDRIISIDEVRRWKPARDVYLHAARLMGKAPEELALVAVHPWDTAGARRAGLISGWVARQTKSYPSFLEDPDVRGATLLDVVRELLKFPQK